MKFLFEYNKIPFGIASGPAVFQDLMNSILQGLLYDFIVVCLDNVTVFIRTIGDHLAQVFLWFWEAGLKLKLSKC